MGFSISRLKQNDLALVVLKDESAGTEVAVLPEFGALLHSFSILMGKSPFNIVDQYSSLLQAKTHIDKTFNSARLSPFVCRIAKGKYKFEGKQYELGHKFLDGSAIHGLLYDKAFSIAAEFAGDQKASVDLLYRYHQDDPGYPFIYDCQVQYTLEADSTLQIRTTVTNRSTHAIPIADGWHPYFHLGGIIDDWLMHFNASKMVEFNDELIPTGQLLVTDLFKEPRRIGPDSMDNCFVLDFKADGASCELFNPGNKLKISFYPDSSYPYLQIYTPSHRRSIAIENLSAAPDCFNNRMGLLLLAPGHSQTFTVLVRLTVV